jgi:hypothetical protein
MLRYFFSFCLVVSLLACGGGGDSSTTTVTGSGINSLGQSPAVSTNAVQTDNNMLVSVSDGPRGFQLAPNANILYATVKVCHPTSGQCVDIDHVQVDTGSVGLRVLASKVQSLGLSPVEVDSGPPALNAWECFPFVIGGLWGANATATVGLGRQMTAPLAIQLIEDNPSAALQAPADCQAAADNMILTSAGALGSNGILGIGSTNVDCGYTCRSGNYGTGHIQYYGCPAGAPSITACSTNTQVADVFQVSNPIFKLVNSNYNTGMVLAMPAVTNPGAATASGELIFGVDTVTGGAGLSNNTVPTGVTKVMLGMDSSPANLPSYLNITTQLLRGANVQTFISSYLDTGTNGLFFQDGSPSPIPRCVGSTWYCPTSNLTLDAILSDGGSATNAVPLRFQVGNAEALFSTSNSAFGDAAGAPPANSTDAFSWGMPFFYGRRVYMSIWDITNDIGTPWYAWSAL